MSGSEHSLQKSKLELMRLLTESTDLNKIQSALRLFRKQTEEQSSTTDTEVQAVKEGIEDFQAGRLISHDQGMEALKEKFPYLKGS